MKNRTTVLRIATTIAFLAVVFCIFCAASLAYIHKIAISTPLYENPDFESEHVLKQLKTNETVEIIGEVVLDANGREWQKVKYNGAFEGYVPASYLYKTVGTEDFVLTMVKATGEEIPLYVYYDESSEVIATLSDGEKLDLVEDDNSYGEFSKVVYDGKYCFVKTENITTGLTYNQRLALIISAALFGTLLVVGIVIVLIIQRKKRMTKPE